MRSAHFAIVAKGLTRRFGNVDAVKRIEMQIKKGIIMGFLGPNGAGKTTTIRMLTCLLRPTSGSATVAGFDICREAIKVKSKIGIVPDELNLYERLTGLEHLYFVGRMFGMDEMKLAERVPLLLDLFGLFEKKDEMIIDYSHGMQKKLAIACALVHDPEVLFLDEPFSGLDPISARLCRQLFIELSHDGTTIFLSSHALEVVEKLCDEVAIVNKGEIVTSGSVDDIRKETESKEGSSLEDIFMKLVNASEPRDLLGWKK